MSVAEPLTPEQIRALDGPALTRLAWEVGLAPVYVRPGKDIPYYVHTGYGPPYPAWNPAENLAQADALFRRLRARGWYTQNDSMETFGVVRAIKSHPPPIRLHDVNWGASQQMTEAHALLLVSVLAVASEQDNGGGAP